MHGPPSNLPPRRTRRKDARPSEIREAALALFSERGFAATRLGDVAERAGVGKGTIYLYFPNKEELFRAVVRHDLLPNLEALEAVADSDATTATTTLRTILFALLATCDRPISAIPKLVIAEAGNFPALARFYVEEVTARGRRLIERVLRRGIEQGEFRAIDVPLTVPLVVAPALMLMLWNTSLSPYAEAPLDPVKVLEHHLDVLFRGLAPIPPSP